MIRPIHRRPSSTPVRACVCVCVRLHRAHDRLGTVRWRWRWTWWNFRLPVVAAATAVVPYTRHHHYHDRRRHSPIAFTAPHRRSRRRRRHEIPNVIGRPEFTIKTATKNYRHRLPFENVLHSRKNRAYRGHDTSFEAYTTTMDLWRALDRLSGFILLSPCRCKHGRDTIYKIT